jgi:hypothetical protein
MRPKTDMLIIKREAAAWLCVCTRTVDRMADLGLLTKIRIGKKSVRFRLFQVLAVAGLESLTLPPQS